MLTVHLTVYYEHERNDDGQPKEENWGEWEVETLPRVGEAIQVERDNWFRTLIVKNVTHFAVQRPVRPTAWPPVKLKEPKVTIYAMWYTGE
jgi:hypothetical protein